MDEEILELLAKAFAERDAAANIDLKQELPQEYLAVVETQH
jgi:hypothetical protein